MLTLSRCLGLLLMMTFAVSAQQTKTVTVTKCQDCSTKASKAFQACSANGGAARAGACQKAYQSKMGNCNKKWCSPKTMKVKVKTGA